MTAGELATATGLGRGPISTTLSKLAGVEVCISETGHCGVEDQAPPTARAQLRHGPVSQWWFVPNADFTTATRKEHCYQPATSYMSCALTRTHIARI